jgi:hypothetical protein
MFQAFKQFFTFFTVMFSAAEKGAIALDALADIGKEMAEGFRDEERIKRMARLSQLRAEAAKGNNVLEMDQPTRQVAAQ